MIQQTSAAGVVRTTGDFSTPADLPVPDRLNLWLSVVVFVSAVTLIGLASQVRSWWAVVGVGIVFSYLLLTDYALLHEATHANLQSNPRRNYWLGVLTGFLFPIPFSMIRVTHQGHHLYNRTDSEMFDLYYPHDNRVVKYLRWYGILCGLFWPLIPLGAVLFSISPRPLRERIFGRPQATGYMFSDVERAAVRAVRLELLGIIAFFAALHVALHLQWTHTLVLYACFSFNWSTRQYVGHAFSKRDVIEGAWNLRHNRLMTWVLLHGEYDKTHHRRPEVSWIYLPRLTSPDDERPSYFNHYWRQWLGPRPNTEPAPPVHASEVLMANP
jgi:fatty acid desaturase